MKKIYIFIHSPVVAFHYYKYQIMRDKRISCALISVYYKDGLAEIVSRLNQLGVSIFSTGGTFDFIRGLGNPCKISGEPYNISFNSRGPCQDTSSLCFRGNTGTAG